MTSSSSPVDLFSINHSSTSSSFDNSPVCEFVGAERVTVANTFASHAYIRTRIARTQKWKWKQKILFLKRDFVHESKAQNVDKCNGVEHVYTTFI